MRLSQIKIVGFKSFVDQTNISFPSNRVGVVGPNGCGKSNVIDAVRWVMGESSAKTLRGESMTDVIFNGSTSRKPADYAEIELIFSEVNLPQYPDASEIAIKRRVGRDAQSQYFLNSIRCRRKDITAIFMGTGLGPRSYAIIEQGMISRFIDAKPEQLRIFMEEAAGISKYKDRRREAELRLQHTVENMERLNDVRTELDKQLEKLRRQSRAAERYKQYTDAVELLKAQLLAMRWRGFDEEVKKHQEIVDTQGTGLETQSAELLELEQRHTELRQEQSKANVDFNEIQARFYAHQSEMDRVSQTIEHTKERRGQLETDLQQTEADIEEARRSLNADSIQAQTLETDIVIADASLQEAEMNAENYQEALANTEIKLHAWQSHWEEHSRLIAEPTQQIQVERTRVQNLQRRQEENRSRLTRLEEENQELDLQTLQSELTGLNTQTAETEARLSKYQEELQGYQQAIITLRDSNQEISERLHEQRAEIQQLGGRQASLEALQESALGKSDSDVTAWLETRGFTGKIPRLAQVLEVEQGWERAVETVLGVHLEALCVEDLSALTNKLDSLPQGKVGVVDKRLLPSSTERAEPSSRDKKSLQEKVRADWPVTALLGGVFVAEDLAAAHALRSQLAPCESVITAQGLWLGPNWLRITEEMDQRAGIFAREQDLKQLSEQLAELEARSAELAERLEQGREELHQREQAREQVQQEINDTQQWLSQLKARQGGQQARLEQMGERAQRLLSEQAELAEHVHMDEIDLEEANERLLIAEADLRRLEAQGEELEGRRESVRDEVDEARRQWEAGKDALHQVTARLQSMRTDAARLQQGIDRLQTQVKNLETKHGEQQAALNDEKPVDVWVAQHEEHLLQHQSLELGLMEAREKVQHLEEVLRQAEETQRTLEARIGQQRGTLEEARLACQSNLVRRQTVEEQLAETEQNVETLLAELPEEAIESVWNEEIEAMEHKIQRLGSINMAALEESSEQFERKEYLDKQYADLEKAMNLLEKAMQTIDADIRERFQNTLNQINENFQKSFPRLFGGGQASLQLVGDDILTAGVTIMARPLGKRNSTIHLLSGGEKALTAIALVFAIFQLNPAPFCMLDEVDAPLDDSNVGRFCALVKSMSEHVQFIFITHNKIAMEMADQLIGVTMQEPGVSRPVAVDMELAVAMAEA